MTLAHGKLYEERAALLNITKSTAKLKSTDVSVDVGEEIEQFNHFWTIKFWMKHNQ